MIKLIHTVDFDGVEQKVVVKFDEDYDENPSWDRAVRVYLDFLSAAGFVIDKCVMDKMVEAMVAVHDESFSPENLVAVDEIEEVCGDSHDDLVEEYLRGKDGYWIEHHGKGFPKEYLNPNDQIQVILRSGTSNFGYACAWDSGSWFFDPGHETEMFEIVKYRVLKRG